MALNNQFLYIVNKSIESGEYPSAWKIATIVPIPKVANPTEAGDLRPVALLPIPGKIVEKVVHKQMINFLEEHKYLDPKQNGFRSKHSTEETIFDFTSDLSIAKNKKLDSLAIFVDFKKAFDTVNHKILSNKLRSYNFGDSSIKWIDSYLNQRKQSTLLNNYKSNLKNVTCGVPQGSILGPLLFLVYINDLSTIIKHSKVLLYADDTVLYRQIDRAKKAADTTKLQSDLNHLSNWCRVNKLTINTSKTKAMYFPSISNYHTQPTLKLNGMELQPVKSYKYLGVEVDSELSSKAQLANTYKKATNKLYLLRCIRPYLTIKAALDICKTTLLPTIDYGNIFLTACTIKELEKLQVVQNNAIRCCLNIPYPRMEHVQVVHDMTNIKKVKERRSTHLLTCVHRTVLNRKLNLVERERQTRASVAPLIDCGMPRTKTIQKTPYFQGCLMWNLLPPDIRELDNLDLFKTRIKPVVHRLSNQE